MAPAQGLAQHGKRCALAFLASSESLATAASQLHVASENYFLWSFGQFTYLASGMCEKGLHTASPAESDVGCLQSDAPLAEALQQALYGCLICYRRAGLVHAMSARAMTMAVLQRRLQRKFCAAA